VTWRLRDQIVTNLGGNYMTKTQTITTLADRSGLSKGQVSDLLDQLALLSYSEAKNGFTIPGIGKLVLVNRKERLGRNPATGETITIPAKTVVKFRIAKACKESVMSA
jgi:DNA-binding protein HU-beta